jgi:hypothetical protein
MPRSTNRSPVAAAKGSSCTFLHVKKASYELSFETIVQHASYGALRGCVLLSQPGGEERSGRAWRAPGAKQNRGGGAVVEKGDGAQLAAPFEGRDGNFVASRISARGLASAPSDVGD